VELEQRAGGSSSYDPDRGVVWTGFFVQADEVSGAPLVLHQCKGPVCAPATTERM